MTEKYQPGEWRRQPYLNGSGRSLSIVDETGFTVASCHGWVGDPDHADEDADIIASAPKMLRALIAAEEDLDDVKGKKPPESLAVVREAIAAARGRR